MSLVFQDEHCFAVLDIDPINPGHVLVIPKRHASSLADLDDVTVHLDRHVRIRHHIQPPTRIRVGAACRANDYPAVPLGNGAELHGSSLPTLPPNRGQQHLLHLSYLADQATPIHEGLHGAEGAKQPTHDLTQYHGE